jgi:hypothetical protein
MSASNDTSQARMEPLERRAFRKNTLHEFAVIELSSGLIVRDISIRDKADKWWASLPSFVMLEEDGRQVFNHAGHKQYAALAGRGDRDLADTFSAAVVDLIRRGHPSNPGGGG